MNNLLLNRFGVSNEPIYGQIQPKLNKYVEQLILARQDYASLFFCLFANLQVTAEELMGLICAIRHGYVPFDVADIWCSICLMLDQRMCQVVNYYLDHPDDNFERYQRICNIFDSDHQLINLLLELTLSVECSHDWNILRYPDDLLMLFEEYQLSREQIKWARILQLRHWNIFKLFLASLEWCQTTNIKSVRDLKSYFEKSTEKLLNEFNHENLVTWQRHPLIMLLLLASG